MEILLLIGFGFLLGIQHSLEPDHALVVMNLASKRSEKIKILMQGFWWALGHSITLFIVGIILILVNGIIPDNISTVFEMIVGILLIFLGLYHIYLMITKKNMNHIHSHGDEMHVHHHPVKKPSNTKVGPLLLGVIQGMAGSGALVALTMSSTESVISAIIYIVFFGLGSVIGMVGFTYLVELSINSVIKTERTKPIITFIVAISSIAYGAFYLYSQF